MHPKSEDRLIVALDVSSAAAAQKIVAALGDSIKIYKVGMQLYTAEGPQIVRDLVNSAREVRALRAKFGANFLIVNPGVRPAGSDHGDQARVVTPAEAIQSGASHIVVGRPITAAKDPAVAARGIQLEIRNADEGSP